MAKKKVEKDRNSDIVHCTFVFLRLHLLGQLTSDVSDLAGLCLRSIKDDEKRVCIVVLNPLFR